MAIDFTQWMMFCSWRCGRTACATSRHASTGTTTPASYALVFQLRGANERHGPPWTRWTKQPGACGYYDPAASTPGVYLADNYGTSGNGKVFRIDDTALTDAINSGTATAISSSWQSGIIRSPFVGAYFDVIGMEAGVLAAGYTGPYDVTLAIIPHANSSEEVSLTAEVNPLRAYGSQGLGRAEWTPEPIGEVESVALAVRRGTTNIVAVRSIEAICQARGLRMGRADL